jgi:hypothetical protein
LLVEILRHRAGAVIGTHPGAREKRQFCLQGIVFEAGALAGANDARTLAPYPANDLRSSRIRSSPFLL